MSGTTVAPARSAVLRAGELHPALSRPVLESMNFLNEVSHRYPDAISLAAGRPHEGLFEADAPERHLAAYRRHLAAERGLTPEQVRRTLFQYGRTKGIIHDLIARMLRLDEGIDIDPESVVVTVGCQEAMVLTLRALRADDRDVLLAVAPTYVGLTGAAALVDLPVVPVPGGPRGVDLDALAHEVSRLRAEGRRPRACYVMPDFANPSGLSLDLATRHALLDAAAALDLLLLEDNPYGLFHGGEHLPTLKALDTGHRVVYFGSFAKTCLPGARVGYVVADTPVAGADGGHGLFADELAKIKGMLTVNTSPVAQAVVGGHLVTHGCSLVAANTAERALYQRNLHLLLDGLAARFPADSGVRWNTPGGGFFVVVDVPFTADDAALEHSAEEYGVLWVPMRHFYDHPDADRRLRLSCSAVSPAEIDEALDRLAAFVASRR
ncbi:PLP-dependent aminotransferase family protein [Streptomyces sp.]|uniref:aminotransferase-like domain-containing protein n=1 Tax=Streptomyces sp. TaxID=1931 RepID=UPI002D45AFE5|nr:PLP-dependent aminotransferase family protein [Streptomyces sp.]HZF89576.1 PLP-dependent aminotransferase family protein [Streptomyces sp.]